MDLLNITNVNYEEVIKKVIKGVRETYKDLTTDMTCMFYSSFINEELRKNHIISRIVSTKDFGINYDHRFVLTKDVNNYYLIDLKYAQFFEEIPEDFKKLNEDGYQIVDKEMINEYIISILGVMVDNDIDNLFFK